MTSTIATENGPAIHNVACDAFYALRRVSEALDALKAIGGRIDDDEYATLAQLEHQWCSTCRKIVDAGEAWKKNQPRQEDVPDDAWT